MKMIQVLVVDDHQIVRQGVRSLLERLRPEWTILEAAGGAEATELIRRENPDLVVMDITLPGLSGLEVTSRLRKAGFDRPILIFTMHISKQLAADTREAGAQGYVLKSQAVEDLVRAIDILFSGGTFFEEPPDLQKDPPKPNRGPLFFAGLKSALALVSVF